MPDSFVIRPATDADARDFVCWQYAAPYDVYTIVAEGKDETAVAQEINYFLNPAINCHVLTDQQGTLQAFCTFGQDGQVPGGDYRAVALDIGMGVRPNLTGRGQGHLFARAVIDFAVKTFQPPLLRVTIAEFNQRARRVWAKQGFVETQRFTAVSWTKRPFIIMIRPIHLPTLLL